ncbi:MAG: hypothetical protein LLG14_16790 [Nocardiaceae bacterium]|nr:hypothetical protein [Nocardiaceae bacterium]
MQGARKYWTDLADALKPRIQEVYDAAAECSFSPRGRKLVDRSMAKGKLSGHVACELLFEPAMLIGIGGTPDDMARLSAICLEIPFAGDYWVWEPIHTVHAATFRALVRADDSRAADIEPWLSVGEFGEPGRPLHEAPLTDRLNGRRLEQINLAQYKRPLSLGDVSYAIERIRELCVMWAYGGSAFYPRARLDDEIDVVKELVGDYFQPHHHSTSDQARV